MPDRPVILHYVGYDDDRGGIVAVVRALAEQRRFDCILGVNTGFHPTRSEGLPTEMFPAVAGETVSLGNWFRTRRAALRVAEWLAQDERRIFHGHSRAGLLVALWLARWRQKRVVATVHCYGKQRWFYRWAAGKLGSRLFWLTPEMQNYYGLPVDERQCVPSCSPGTSDSRVSRERLASFPIVIGGIGSLVRWKGWHRVIEALSLLPQAVQEKIRFIHIGSTQNDKASAEYAAELKMAGARTDLKARIEWRGEQATPELFLNEIDVLVVPSENEPFSLAMIEALSVGVPVIRADSGGATGVIAAGKNGWLFRTGDAGDLARIFCLLAETDALGQIAIDARALQPYHPASVAVRWAQVYKTLLS